jgi:hypothetical protein
MVGKCPLCDGNLHEKLFIIDLTKIAGGETTHKFTACRCRRCGAVTTTAGELVEVDENILFFVLGDCVLIRPDGTTEFSIQPQFVEQVQAAE